jgi:hypothetical protein
MTVSSATGVSLSAGYTPPSWPTTNTTNGGTVTGLISSTGTYNKYIPGRTLVASSNIKSHVMTATAAGDNTSSLLLDTVNIPANVVGPDGWLELEVTWGCNNSANVKQLVPVNWTTNAIGLDQQTTNTSSTFRMILANRNSMHTQMLPSAAPASGVQGSTTAVQTLSQFMDTGENAIGLWGVTTSATSGDTIWIERWSLEAVNPTVYSSKRLNQGKVQFYGANAHYDDSQSIAQHIADMKVMGMKTIRMAYVYGTSLATLVSYATALQADGTGIQMCCCIAIPYPNTFTSEAQAYASGFAAGQLVASTLGPLGVTIYEAGNELDQGPGMIVSGNNLGGFASDFSNTLVPFLRGEMRGCIDGVHSAGNYLCASNAFTQCGIGVADLLWNGYNVDGSLAATGPLRWDLTNWHNYEDYGPMMGVSRAFAAGTCNLFEHMNRTYGGVPIIITEWNGKASDTDPQRAWWANRWLAEAYNNRYKYNIAFVCCYELYGSPWNLMASAGTPVSTFGTTVQTFITNNPDPGT